MNNLRSSVFWMKDRLSGNSIKAHLRDVRNYLQGENAAHFRTERLLELLRHAAQHVPYYEGFEPLLENFPVIDKGMIRASFERFIASGYQKKEMKKVVTSGSTGLPFQVFHPREKSQRNTADTMYFGKMAGFRFGSPLAYLKIWNEVNTKSGLRQKMEHIIPVNVVNLSPKAIKELLEKLENNYQSISFLGYASALESIARVIQNEKLTFQTRVNSVLTMSEALDDEGRKQIARAFNCQNVFARYSNVENGIIAQQYALNSSQFLINTASYVVEVLDDQSKPLPDGKVGRIVITDLFNYGMPMVRYDTGDIGVKKVVRINEREHQVFERVEGRKMDAIYSTSGDLLSSFIITNGMWKYTDLLQYQFIQVSTNEYLFKLNAPDGFHREAELVDDYKQLLGQDALIKTEYVDEIPLLSSGKRKKVVNLMKQS